MQLRSLKTWKYPFAPITSGNCMAEMVPTILYFPLYNGFIAIFLQCYSWAQEFLDDQNNGLDVLVEYLSHAQSDSP